MPIKQAASTLKCQTRRAATFLEMDPQQRALGGCFPPGLLQQHRTAQGAELLSADARTKHQALLDPYRPQSPLPTPARPPEPTPHCSPAPLHPSSSRQLFTDTSTGSFLLLWRLGGDSSAGRRQTACQQMQGKVQHCGGVSTAAGPQRAARGCRLSHTLALKGTERARCLGGSDGECWSSPFLKKNTKKEKKKGKEKEKIWFCLLLVCCVNSSLQGDTVASSSCRGMDEYGGLLSKGKHPKERQR